MMLHQPYPRRKLILILFTIGLFLGTTFFVHHLGNNLDNQVHAARNYALRSAAHPDDKNGVKTISYVTSFWASERPTTRKINPHRREVEAALLANIYNPHIDQVVVFLDGVSTGDDVDEEHKSSCSHFHRDMKETRHRFLKIIARGGLSEVNAHHNGVDPMSKVECVNVFNGQPTYHQMFLNALSDVVTGDIVVMANADMVFDNSIAKAKKLKEDVLLVLGTRGFSTDATPTWTRTFYDVIVRLGRTSQELKDWDVDQCSNNHWSWDTWIFHKKSIQGKLQEEHFQRQNINNEMAFFYMNENGAENAALWAMEESSSFATTYNACDEIQSWSFHLTPKTHHDQGTPWPAIGDSGIGRNPNRRHVPWPWGGSERTKWGSPPYAPKRCEKENGCFYE